MAPQFTQLSKEALEKAFSFAQEHKHTEVNENHLLLAFFIDPQGYFYTFSHSLNLNPKTLIPQLQAALKKVPTFSSEPQPPLLSAQLQNQIAQAQTLAKQWNDTYISSDHFFYISGNQPQSRLPHGKNPAL